MKKIYLFITSLLLGLTMSAQEENPVRNLLKRTEGAIYKAQKEMIVGNTPKKNQELTLSVKYQALAVQSLQNNDIKLAVCYSLKSREYSNEILVNISPNKTEYYLPSKEENQLGIQNGYLVTDDNYKTKITPDLIDDSVLFDPQKLGAAYKISIN